MSRRRYVVTYDISDDKRRTRVFKTLCDHGDHVQYSVFFCELNRMELVHLKAEIAGHLHHREDQVLMLDLGDAENPLDRDLECLGRPFEPDTRVLVV